MSTAPGGPGGSTSGRTTGDGPGHRFWAVAPMLRGASARLGLGVEWERPRPDAAALRSDLLVGLALVLASLICFEITRSAGLLADGQRHVAEQLAWTVASVLPLCVRRRCPVAAMALASVVFLGLGVRDPVVSTQVTVQIFLFAALYNGVAWGRDRRATAVVLSGILVLMTGWIVVIFAQASGVQDLVGSRADADGGPEGLLPQFPAVVAVYALINVVYFVGAAVFGQVSWHRALQADQLAEQAARLAAQQDEMARRAVVDERLRIARELHDVAAHHVSVIGVQAAAARRVLAVDAEAAGRALSAVEQSSREAVGEMRQLLGVLRNHGASGADAEPDDRRPQPGLDTLEDLFAGLGRQGLQVELVRVGEPVPVPSAVSLSLYRTVQEALANVCRHSTARSATVTVRWGAPPVAWVEVEVIDAGRPRPGTTSGTGLGHVGMRERGALHHGEVEIGARPLGGYRVRVRLPLDRGLGAPADAAAAGVVR